jgi:hypothetical protein
MRSSNAARVSTSTRLQNSAAVRDGSMDIAGTKQEKSAFRGWFAVKSAGMVLSS